MTRRDDIVAALERAIEYTHIEDRMKLQALADALRKGQEAWLDRYKIPKWSEPAKGGAGVWIIPEPRIARRALSGEGE